MRDTCKSSVNKARNTKKKLAVNDDLRTYHECIEYMYIHATGYRILTRSL